MTGCGDVPIPDSLNSNPAAWGYMRAEKRAQLALGPLMRLQRLGMIKLHYSCIVSHPLPSASVAAPG